jgi:hypothetical protein
MLEGEKGLHVSLSKLHLFISGRVNEIEVAHIITFPNVVF